MCMEQAYWSCKRSQVGPGSNTLMKSLYDNVSDNLAGKYYWMSVLECDNLIPLRANPSVLVNIWHRLLRPNQICNVTRTYSYRQNRVIPAVAWQFSVSQSVFESTTVIENSWGCSSLSTEILITVLFAVSGAGFCFIHLCDITVSSFWFLGL